MAVIDIASLAAIRQPVLLVFVGDHRQTMEDCRKDEQLQSTARNSSNGLWAHGHSIELVICRQVLVLIQLWS